jgi:hypothetical protein
MTTWALTLPTLATKLSLSSTRRSSRSPFHSVNVGILRIVLLATKSSLALLKMSNHPRSPPAFFANNVITDDEANEMELQEETESVSTARRCRQCHYKGGLCGPSDVRFLASIRCPKTLPQSVLRGYPRSVCRSTYSQQKTSVRQPFQTIQ